MKIRVIEDPNDATEVQAFSAEVAHLLAGGLHSGDAIDPAGAENGVPGAMLGSWVYKAEIASLVSPIQFRHNLGVSLAGTDSGSAMKPNVRWPVMSAIHDGTGGDDPIALVYRPGDTITENSIRLRVTAGARTVDATHPIRMQVRFEPAHPW